MTHLLSKISLVILLSALSPSAGAGGINSPPGVDVHIGAGGNQVQTITASGLIGIGTATPHAMLSVNGGVQIGTDTTCDTSKAGTLSYDSSTKQLSVCDGATLQLVSGGEGGGYVMYQGSCSSGNPLVTDRGCDCPTGYTAAETSESESNTSSNQFYQGYTCFPNSAAGAPAPPPTRWVQDGGEQISCDTGDTNPATPSSWCSPPPMTTPCTAGQTNYTVASCQYGTRACQNAQGVSVPGWSMGYYSYTCQ